jgi:hypothetical protein
MRKDFNLGILFSPLLFLAGIFLLRESTAHSQWYMDIYLIVGAVFLASGLMMLRSVIKRFFLISRLERHHARNHH